MDIKIKSIISLFARYILLVILAVNNLYIVYAITTLPTVYASYALLSLFYDPIILLGTKLFFGNSAITIVGACVAGAAYYLLLILNLSTPMPIKKRLKSISFLLVSFFILNVLRIAIFSALFDAGFSYFDLSHKIVWHAGSTILLLALWFINIKLFKIKEIPVYTDIKTLYSLAKSRKAKKIKRNK